MKREIHLITNPPVKNPPSALEQLEQISKIISLIGIPFVVAVFGWLIQQELAEKSINKDYVQIAVTILSDDETQSNEDLRTWAVDLLNATSPTPFSQETAAKLTKGEVSLPESVSRNPVNGSSGPSVSEITLEGYQLTLPASVSSSKHELFQMIQDMADQNLRYYQHPWSMSTDQQNLSMGVDTSRAIWFAFTRSGLDYLGGRYLTTAQMVSERQTMMGSFSSCMGAPSFKDGDVLVYRDEIREQGIALVVIDPEAGVVWGSFGWDSDRVTPKTGVVFQTISQSRRWGSRFRPDNRLRACWRHKDFVSLTG